MGRIVMKEAPDVDFYVEWSSVVEAPTFGGTRVETLEHLARESDPWLREDAPHHPEQRLRRADKTGTSSQWVKAAGLSSPEEGAWDDDGLIYMQRGIAPRANIFTLTRRLLEQADADVTDLLVPFDDAEEVRPA